MKFTIFSVYVLFLSPPVQPAPWAHMHRFPSFRLSVCLSVTRPKLLDKKATYAQGHMGRGQRSLGSTQRSMGSRSAKHSRYWQVGSHQRQVAFFFTMYSNLHNQHFSTHGPPCHPNLHLVQIGKNVRKNGPPQRGSESYDRNYHK